MWGSVLGVGLLMAVDPLRLGVILILLSRARPLANLLAYWVGCLIIGIPSLVVPLVMLHATSMFGSFGHDLANPATGASSTTRHIQIALGAFTLVIAALMSVRLSTRQRASTEAGGRHRMPARVGGPASDGDSSNVISDDIDRESTAEPERQSMFRRLLRRGRNAWENGAWWISLLVGIGSGPPAPVCLVVLTAIVASGAAIGTQFIASIAFVLGVFALAEVILVCYLITPTKTQTVLQLLHDRLRPYRSHIVIGVVAVVGLFTLASGFGLI